MSSVLSHITIRNQEIYLNGKLMDAFAAEDFEEFLLKVYEQLNIQYPKFYKMDRQSQAGLIGSELLLRNTDFNACEAEHKAIVLSNKSGSFDTDVRFLQSTKAMASPALFVYTLPNIVAGEICIRHGIKGENTFLVMPQFSPEMIVPYIDNLFSTTDTKMCMAGWVEVNKENHHIFLYLASKENQLESMPHTIDMIKELFYI